MHSARILTCILTGLVSGEATQAQLSRPGVAHLDARQVVVSVFPDSLDGVHLDAKIRHKKDWVSYSARFRPEDVLAWVTATTSLVQANALDTSADRTVQSGMLVGLGGAQGIVFALPAKKRKKSSYWLLHRLEKDPLLIDADPQFTDTLLISLREAAHRSAIDSGAFESGLVAPLQQRPDSLNPWPVDIPTPVYPSTMAGAGMDGLVQVRYVIDSNGRVDMSTFEVLWASASEFVPPVRAALRRGRFRPGRLGAQAVRSRVYQNIRFRVQGQRAHWN